MNAYAVIMAGGNGERFWPLSTPEKPKQFLDLFGGRTLIRQAVERLDGLIPPERIFVVTAERFVALTRASLPMVPADHIVGEPCRRDTAAAVATACGIVRREGGDDAVGCVLAADLLIGPDDLFRETLADAIGMASATDVIVTMGIVPTRPETGFGYIACGQKLDSGTATVFHEVARFVEKPTRETAERYHADGGYLWNSGMFIWKARTMRDAFRANASDLAALIDAVSESTDAAAVVNLFYPQLRAISVDFAVMEHARNIIVAESRFNWDDVGSWTAVENHFPADENGNVALGNVHALNANDNVLFASPGHRVAVMGIRDLVVVTTPTATLVCPKSELRNLKKLVGIV